MGDSDSSMMQKSMKIAGVVALYWVVSISMVFLNKYLLSGVELRAPMFVTWFQCVVAVAVCWLLGLIREQHSFLNQFPVFEYDLAKARKVLPLSLVFVGMIAFNNLCLDVVGVAFYNVGRSLTTIFNVILSYFMLQQSTSMKAMGACAIIIIGFFVGVDEEKSSADLRLIGVFYGIMASLCVALNSIFIKKVLPEVDGDLWRLTGYNNMNAVFLFLPVMIVMGEIPLIAGANDIYRVDYWLWMTLAGFFGIAIGLVSMLQVTVTSPLTHNISGTAKACAQTILALQLTEESRSMIWWLGNLLVLGGSFAYAVVKRAEMKKSHTEVKTSDKP